MTCKTCGKPLGGKNKSGYCRQHFSPTRCDGWTEHNRDRWTPEYRERMRVKLRMASRARLSWCPLEYRDEYRRLTRMVGLRAKEARKTIAAIVATDTRRFLATGKLQQSVRG